MTDVYTYKDFEDRTVFYKNGRLHRDGDKPAIIRADGTQFWYKDDQIHRDGDKPAIIRTDGTQFWYKNDKKHRDGDKPAVIHADGTQEWYRNGEKYTPAHAQDCNPSNKSVIIDGKRYKLVPEE
jgi:predicted lipoprotein with Yx(FWY)xxD motif